MFDKLRNRWARGSAWLVRRMGAGAYLWLAAAVSLFVVIDFAALHLVGTMESRVFDLLMSHRLRAPAPDPDIVIVDIDEASLAAMAPDFGRWPWPNEVFGEFVAGIEAQQPKAIVFDILFSDADVLRPDSDAAFNAAVAASRHSFFPMLRLGPQNDALSQIRPSMLPGVAPLPGATALDRPLAIVLPHVPAAIANGRLGTHNVEPDKDGVIRRYPFRLEHAGWGIPALPSRVAAALGAAVPDQRSFLINWRGKPFTYPYVSFAAVYRDLLRQHRQRPAGEFAGKIVVIGATAASLFDLKASPMAKIHPGVEVLATAIDNVRRGDWLREQPPWLTLAISLAFIWGMAVALARRAPVDAFNSAFTAMQVVFAGVSYATLNLSPYYLDMSAPITLGLVYFSLARGYANLSRRWLANGLRFAVEDRPQGTCRMTLLSVRLDAPLRAERRRMKAALDRLVADSPLQASRIDQLIEDPGLVRSVFDDITLIYWLTDVHEDAAGDARRIEAGLRQALPKAAAAGRLAFFDAGGELRWEAARGWRSAAYRTILAALAGMAPAAGAISSGAK
ncbi:MAG: CHASE2 domain-containing protein [Rhodocyclaceae bacterium]|nr:CHASE2 domain-containing protein [Rhodocyclaceae bacterium]